MIAQEADLIVLDDVMQTIFAKAQEEKDNNNKKMEKAYMRIWLRLQKVYIRTDANINHVEGNA